jgi:hypothetical protein
MITSARLAGVVVRLAIVPFLIAKLSSCLVATEYFPANRKKAGCTGTEVVVTARWERQNC